MVFPSMTQAGVPRGGRHRRRSGHPGLCGGLSPRRRGAAERQAPRRGRPRRPDRCRGMPQDAVLTSVDIDPEHQRMAKQAYVEAGLGSFRTRMITGPALEVLPRLTDGAYDMVFCDAQKREYPDYLIDALRLLRPGGVVAFDNALWHDRVADPEYRAPDTEAIRE